MPSRSTAGRQLFYLIHKIQLYLKNTYSPPPLAAATVLSYPQNSALFKKYLLTAASGGGNYSILSTKLKYI